MDSFVIEGGNRLYGRVRVNGSKNAALPMLAACLLTDEPVVLRDVPNLADIGNMLRLLGELGVTRDNLAAGEEVDAPPARGVLSLRVTDPTQSHARYDIVRTMRASICTLGPMLAKRGYARVSMPGGCAIGDRPVDLHLRGLEALGAQITQTNGDIIARAPQGGLVGATIFLGGAFGSTVLGTANVMCAAALARGTTVIESAACEPEVVDLATLLNTMGAKVRGAGSPRVIVEGVRELSGADYTVMADRIEAGTLMIGAAMTNGDLIIENCPTDALLALTYTLRAAGVHVDPVSGVAALSAGAANGEHNGHANGHSHPGEFAPALARGRASLLSAITGSSEGAGGSDGENPLRRTVRVTCERVIKPVEVTTQPHPGYPTDLQAQLVAMLCLADGNSVVTERIFPDRFLHVAELLRMGAKINRVGATVVISGVRRLKGAPVMASDLRASAGLVLAGLAAEGTTIVNRVYHLDRGYERFEDRLRMLGANIQRVDEKELAAAPVC
ncbi:MAG TPA: UDP-N-acetylglucosamine 1-carboxyvinyltransferase [Phycisphaerales bacterium]|nr:UDP-N-acetylglucosamine 1-carboxyvinyltransferase [Phycisphaerales bacterium]